MKPILNIFIGNIGCGKSTLARKLAKAGAVVVNMDSIQQMIGGGDYGRYDYGKKEIYHAIEETAIENALSKDYSVVVDRTNMNMKQRKRFIDIGKKHDAHIIAFDWGAGDREDVERRIKDPRGVTVEKWETVYQYMGIAYERPKWEEGFDDIVKPPKEYRFHAFDFDGTIVENKYPEIGAIRPDIVESMNEIWASSSSNIIIIWTCRSGDDENKVREFLLSKDIPFDFINENPIFDTGSRKIYAHKYYDDRNA